MKLYMILPAMAALVCGTPLRLAPEQHDDGAPHALVENAIVEDLDRDKREAKLVSSSTTFLEKYGYLDKRRHPGATRHSPEAKKQAIKRYQRFNNLPETGMLDTATRKQMAKPRCGVADTVQGKEGLYRVKRFYVPGYKWKKNQLTWLVRNYSSDLPMDSQRRAFHDAFNHWRQVAPLDFFEISEGNPDFELKFASYEHGDGVENAFDGKGGVLAHAFFPEIGDTHFDESEDWTEGTIEGTNLMTMAVHQLGHALGLGHSNVQGAVMTPNYQGYDPNFTLHDDDIRAIQTLYGSRESK